jgi:predicted transcriptional regulator
MFEPNNEPVYVDVNTDDLDAFSDLMSGRAKIKEDDTNTDPVQNDDDTVADIEDNLEDDNDDTSDEAPDANREGEDDDSDDVKEKPKKVNKVQERINKVLERERLARERADALEREVNELKRAKEPAPTAPIQNVQDGPDPNATNEDGSEKYPLGEFDPSYIRDLTRHTIKIEQAAAKAQEAQERAQLDEQAARTELDTNWKSKLEAVTDKHEDFFDKTVELESAFENIEPQYGDYLVQTIKSLDHGPEVLYYFANNLDEAQKFVKMGPLKATLVLGEINAMFKGQTRKEPKVSSAPPPPQVNKGSNTRKAVSADTDDLDAFSQMFFTSKKR